MKNLSECEVKGKGHQLWRFFVLFFQLLTENCEEKVNFTFYFFCIRHSATNITYFRLLRLIFPFPFLLSLQGER